MNAERLSARFDWMEERVRGAHVLERVGRVVEVTGLIIESEGPDVSLGDICRIQNERGGSVAEAEVVGFRDNRVLLMPLDEAHGLHPGCRVAATGRGDSLQVGAWLRGRVLDGLGRPIDGKGPLQGRAIAGDVARGRLNPMRRRLITRAFETGVKAIDAFAPMGEGQRMGIFAGSGVGKSTLLGMVARGVCADVNVIALVGERGRELREFIERDLGPEGLARSIVIISTSDQPAPLRVHAAKLATRVAESLRDSGQRVLFRMASVTRRAMAQREIGLAVGEPPATRGYTPSVFALLARLLERSGMGERGSITAFYTVLVEGDDMNEPIADAVRGILDGHLVLSRSLATRNHFPAIDILESVSRLARTVSSPEHQAMAGRARDMLALYRRSEDLINVGAYRPGTNSHLDNAVRQYDALTDFLQQEGGELWQLAKTLEGLKGALG